jgi:DNA-binding GntR family transcriptional regulator
MARTPIYKRIIEDIRAKVASGELKPGDQLPSTAQIAAQYACSLTQVRTAIAVLRELDVVEGHQGKGVYVRMAEPGD